MAGWKSRNKEANVDLTKFTIKAPPEKPEEVHYHNTVLAAMYPALLIVGGGD